MHVKALRISIAVGVALLLPSVLVTAQDAGTFTSITGKVQVSDASELWLDAHVGMRLTPGTTVSTGFGASAVVDLGHSELRIQPLTRLRLEELMERDGLVSTDLSLRVGKVRAEVRTAEGLRHDFKVRSAVSTAAVRGTVFEYDGFTIEVENGIVAFVNRAMLQRSYSAGESGSTTGNSRPQSAERTRNQHTGVSGRTGERGDEGDSRQSEVGGERQGGSPYGTIVIDFGD